MNLNALKGILIILVIIDHNDFSRSLFPGFLEGLTFHVVGFMTIPFLKPAGPWNREFLNYAFRQYYPFFLVTTLMALLVACITPVPALTQFGLWAKSVYSGDSETLKHTTQMALLWFLPSFISVVAIRTALAHAGVAMQVAAAALLCLAHLFVSIIAAGWRDVLPMGLLPALYIVPLAWCGAQLHRHVFERLPRLAALALAALAFVIVKTLQMQASLYNEVGFAMVADYRQPLAMLLNDLEAVCGVLMLFQIARFELPQLLQACGRFSMQIYLGHAFVALIIYKLLGWLGITAGALESFLVSLLLTIAISLLAARWIWEHERIRRLVFPRNPADLLHPASRPRMESTTAT